MLWAAHTDVGRFREHNEDFFLTPRDLPDLDPALSARLGRLFVVCDGVGGANAGEVASELAAHTLMRLFYDPHRPDEPPRILLPRLIRETNAAVLRVAQERPGCLGMATTLVCAHCAGNEVTLASVGDSRGYVFRHGALRQLTEDHSPVWQLYRQGILTKEEARLHPMNNIIAAALGFDDELPVHVHVEPAIEGDVFLLCTDGLSDLVPDPVLERLLEKGKDPGDTCRGLVKEALRRGGADNVTSVILAISDVDKE